MKQSDRSAGHSQSNPSLALRTRAMPAFFPSVMTTNSHMTGFGAVAQSTPFTQLQQPMTCADAVALANLHRSRDSAVLAQMGEHSTRLYNTFLINNNTTTTSTTTRVDAKIGAAMRYPSPVSDDGVAGVTAHAFAAVTAAKVASCVLPPPKLLREPARKYAYVDSLVDMATLFVEALWPLRGSVAVCHAQRTELNRFLTNTIRISKTSLSTLQLALFYCLRLRRDQASSAAMALPTQDRCPCPRLNFLSALILASKYLQDRNFSNRAWSKISGVSVLALNLRERNFLQIVNWNLTLSQAGFTQWAQYLERFVTDVRDNLLFGDVMLCRERWHFVLEKQLVGAPESELSRVIAVCGSPLAGPQLTVVAEAALSRSSLPLTPPVSFTDSYEEISMLSSSLPSDAAAVSYGSGGGPCPFFDEFVKSTPKDSPLPVSQRVDVIAAQQCPTPDSLQTDSPALSFSLEGGGCSDEAYCLVSRVCRKRSREEEERSAFVKRSRTRA